MTKPKVPRDPVDPGRQALAILRQLGDWISASPGRTVSVTFGADGWHVALDERRRTSGGSITDAMAQAAQVASFESTEVTP